MTRRDKGFDKEALTEQVADRARSMVKRLDSYQRRHPALGVPIAVLRKFIEDESTGLASQIAFWAFFRSSRCCLSWSPYLATSYLPTCKVMCWARWPAIFRCSVQIRSGTSAVSGGRWYLVVSARCGAARWWSRQPNRHSTRYGKSPLLSGLASLRRSGAALSRWALSGSAWSSAR